MRNDPLPPSPDLLTVEQFAERMQVSRTTVFGWIKAGALKERVHYIRLGRVLRFRWGVDLFFNRQTRPNNAEDAPETPPPATVSTLDSQRGEAPVNHPPLTLDRHKGPAINLDY